MANYEALEKLVALRDRGALTPQEFAEQRRIIVAGGAELHDEASQDKSVSAQTGLQKLSTLSFGVGLCAVVYSTFIYDTTISPIEASSAYLSINEDSSIQEQARAINDLSDRYQRTVAGERTINLPRVETQRRIFSFGALLMLLGAIGYVVPLARHRE